MVTVTLNTRGAEPCWCGSTWSKRKRCRCTSVVWHHPRFPPTMACMEGFRLLSVLCRHFPGAVSHMRHTHTPQPHVQHTRQTNMRQRRLARATHASLAQGSMDTRHSAVLLRVITHAVNMTCPQSRNHPHTTVSNTTAGRGVNTQRHNNGCGRCSPHQAWCARNR